jgi:hypothetical protein
MDMNQAAVFLAGSVLTMIGFVVIVVGLVIINNIFHRYWKPVKMWKFEAYPPQFMHQDPLMDQPKEKELKK